MPSTAVCLAFLIPASAVCLAYLVCTVVGMKSRVLPAHEHPIHFAILIPAHNEETTLGAALRSIAAQNYPAEHATIYVVADNCTDATADVSRSHGAECIVRSDHEHVGKGYALAAGIAWLARRAIEGSDRPSLAHPANGAMLILDSDCELSPTALRELNATFAAGADVVQTSVWSRNADAGPAGYVAAVGAAIDDAVAAGRDRLGMRVPLRGTGMALRRDVLDKVKWDTASPVEDAEYDSQLRKAGVRVRFCPNAIVSCDAPANVKVLCRQRRRRALAGPLAGKPLLLAHLFATVSLCIAANLFTGWAVSLLLGTSLIYLKAMAAVGFTRHRFLNLMSTPIVLLRLLGVALAGLVLPKPVAWERTPRLGEGRESS